MALPPRRGVKIALSASILLADNSLWNTHLPERAARPSGRDGFTFHVVHTAS